MQLKEKMSFVEAHQYHSADSGYPVSLMKSVCDNDYWHNVMWMYIHTCIYVHA